MDQIVKKVVTNIDGDYYLERDYTRDIGLDNPILNEAVNVSYGYNKDVYSNETGELPLLTASCLIDVYSFEGKLYEVYYYRSYSESLGGHATGNESDIEWHVIKKKLVSEESIFVGFSTDFTQFESTKDTSYTHTANYEYYDLNEKVVKNKTVDSQYYFIKDNEVLGSGVIHDYCNNLNHIKIEYNKEEGTFNSIQDNDSLVCGGSIDYENPTNQNEGENETEGGGEENENEGEKEQPINPVEETEVSVTETFLIKVKEVNYKNGIFLMWINTLGGVDSWLFNSQKETQKTKSLGFFKETESDYSLDHNPNKERGKISKKELSLISLNISESERKGLDSLLSSVKIWIYDKDNSALHEVNVKHGSFNSNKGSNNQTLKITLLLQDRNTITI